mmetsp:Transcript_30102/g.54459  ORF Transcript_30102/g.54459 Transcript_30102/m.54459 type:complete len:206 (+) Transcript_30102:51-668(+)
MCCKVEIQGQDTTFKRRAESAFARTIPLSIDNLKGNILVGWSSMKTKDTKLGTICLFQEELWCLGLVNEVRIENVKLVALYNLGRRVIMIVMSLIVLVPVISSLDTVEVARFARTPFVLPRIRRSLHVNLVIQAEFIFEITNMGINICGNHASFLFLLCIFFDFTPSFCRLELLFLLFKSLKLANQHFLVKIRQFLLGKVHIQLA